MRVWAIVLFVEPLFGPLFAWGSELVIRFRSISSLMYDTSSLVLALMAASSGSES